MLYLIREKTTQNLCYEVAIADDVEVEVGQIYPSFDGATMEMGHWSGDRESVPQPFTINAQGAICALTLDEKITAGLIEFGEDLMAYLFEQIPLDSRDDLPPMLHTAVKLVQLGLDKGLLNNALACRQALDMMDEEIEVRVKHHYPQSVELKLVKQCLDWVLAGQPKGDPRQQRYQQMNDDISLIKDEYRALRQTIKLRLSEFLAAMG